MDRPAQPNVTLDRVAILGITVLIAGFITYIQIAQPDIKQMLNIKEAEAPKVETTEPQKETQAEPQKPSETTPAPTSTPAPAPTPAPAAAPAAKTATTVSFVHMRTGKSTNTPIVTNLDGGTVVELRSDSDKYWQGVVYQGKNGYIYKTYLQY